MDINKNEQRVNKLIIFLLIIIIILVMLVLLATIKPELFKHYEQETDSVIEKGADFYGSYNGTNLTVPVEYSVFTNDGWYLYSSNEEDHSNMKYDYNTYLTLYGLHDNNSEKNLKNYGVYGYVIRSDTADIDMTWNGLSWNSSAKDFIKTYGKDNCSLIVDDKSEEFETVNCKFDNIRLNFEFEENELYSVEVYDKIKIKGATDEVDIDYTTDNENISRFADFYGSYNGTNLSYPIDYKLFINDGWYEEDDEYKSKKYSGAVINLYSDFYNIDENGIYEIEIEFKDENNIPNMTFNGIKPFASKNEVIAAYGKPYATDKNEYTYYFDDDSYILIFEFKSNKLYKVDIQYNED